MDFIINKNNFIFDLDKSDKPIKLDNLQPKKDITSNILSKNKQFNKKYDSIDLKNNNSTTKNFSKLMLNISIYKGDTELIKNVYLNILENLVKYSIISNEISRMFILCYDFINKLEKLPYQDKENQETINIASNQIISAIRNIKLYYKKLDVNLDKYPVSLYDLLRYVDNKNLEYFINYVQTQEISNKLLDKKLKENQLYTNVSIPISARIKDYTDSKARIKDYTDSKFKVIRDKNCILYSKYSKNQNSEYSFYQTICQPLIIDNGQAVLSNNKEKLDSTKEYEITMTEAADPIKNQLYVINNNITDTDNYVNFTKNIFLPKFLGNNSLPYDSALENYLLKKQETPDNKLLNNEYIKLFRRLYTENTNTWKTPEPISGELDIDIQILELEKRLRIINREVIHNYIRIQSCKLPPKLINRGQEVLEIISDEVIEQERLFREHIDDESKLSLIEVRLLLKKLNIVNRYGSYDNEKNNIENFKTPLKYGYSNNEIILSEYD